MSIPLLKSPVDLSGYGHQTVRLVGQYRVQTVKVGRKKGTQGNTKKIVLLIVDDRTLVDLFDRPEDEMQALADQLVVVTGRVLLPVGIDDGPIMAQRDELPCLVDIESVEQWPQG